MSKINPFAKAALTFVSAAAVGATGVNVAQAVCGCTFGDIMPTHKQGSLGRGSFIFADSSASGNPEMFHADLPSDNLYGLKTSVAPVIQFYFDQAFGYRVEAYVDTVYTDIQRWAAGGFTWENGDNAGVDPTVQQLITLDVDSIASTGNNTYDSYYVRTWWNDNGVIVDMEQDRIKHINGLIINMASCW